MKKKIKEILKKIIYCILNPRFLVCFGIGWIITNGWSYAMFATGMHFGIGWMIAVSSAYLAFLWLPISPEKLVTVTIAMFLLRWLFPNDEKTLGVLRELYATIKGKHAERKEMKKQKGKDGESKSKIENENKIENKIENENKNPPSEQ